MAQTFLAQFWQQNLQYNLPNVGRTMLIFHKDLSYGTEHKVKACLKIYMKLGKLARLGTPSSHVGHANPSQEELPHSFPAKRGNLGIFDLGKLLSYLERDLYSQ